MPKCAHCQADLPTNTRICTDCGTTIDESEKQATSSASVLATSDSSFEQASQTNMSNEISGDKAEQADSDNQTSNDDTDRIPRALILAALEEKKRKSAQLVAESEEKEPQTAVEAVDTEDEEREQSKTVGPIDADKSEGEPQEALELVDFAVLDTQDKPLQGAEKVPVSVKRRIREWVAGGTKGKGGLLTKILVGGLIVVILVTAIAGAFALVQRSSSGNTSAIATQTSGNDSGSANCAQHKCSSTPTPLTPSATKLTFMGKVSGLLTASSVPQCQMPTGTLHDFLMIVTGTIGNQAYEFSFTIETYHGSGTYVPSFNQLIAVTLTQDTTHLWATWKPPVVGRIIIDRGGRSGSIKFSLNGAQAEAGSTVQVSGSWACKL
jgi:hypothetical protein